MDTPDHRLELFTLKQKKRAVTKSISPNQDSTDKAIAMKAKLYEAIEWLLKHRELLCKKPDTQFTRNRKFDAFTFLHYLLTQSAQALASTLEEYFDVNEIDVPTKSAVCQLKGKLAEEAMPTLFDKFNCLCEDKETFRGYKLIAVDGTAINIARNPNSDTYFAKGDYNQYLMTALYDVCNCTYLDAEIKSRTKQYEVRSAINLLEKVNLPPNTIILADRLYSTLNFEEHLNRQKVKYLVRCKTSHSLWEIDRLPDEECDVWVSKELRTTQTAEDQKAFREKKAFYIQPYSDHNKEQSSWDFESKCTMRFRLVKVWIGDKWEVLLTNLSEKEFSVQELKELYHLRWGIETSFRDLKYSMGLTNLHTRKEEYTRQEIYARLIVFNLAQRIIRSVILRRNRKKHRNWDYAVNVKEGFLIIRNFLRRITDFTEGIIQRIGRHIEAVRPDRKDRRKEPKPKGFVSFIYRVA